MKFTLKSFKSVKSTNDTAINLIKKNFTKPTIVTSERQKKGRGTMGKKWVSQKGNLFLSIFFEINPSKINFKHYAILNALIIKKILNKYISKKIHIKWPNDLMIEKKKFCGILQEIISHKKKFFIVIGVGINTNFSPILSTTDTTSLKFAGSKKVNNVKVLKEIKNSYEKFVIDVKKYKFQKLKHKVT